VTVAGALTSRRAAIADHGRCQCGVWPRGTHGAVEHCRLFSLLGLRIICPIRDNLFATFINSLSKFMQKKELFVKVSACLVGHT
jgi:hypothetical protein